MRAFMLLVLVLNVFNTQMVNAQDPQHSHIYAVPLHLGPSFAGSAGATRVGVNARDQWMAVDREHVNYSLMFDHHFYGTRSGVGLIYMNDFAGDGILTTRTLSLQYAVNVNLGPKLSIRPGLQGTYAQRTIDYSRIVFGDQLDFVEDRPVSMEPTLVEKKNYTDFTASLLGIYGNYWFGGTVSHLARPNQSLIGGESIIPVKYLGYAGGRFTVKKTKNNKRVREHFYFMLHYSQQETFRQAYLGSYWERSRLITGVWYRGVPFLKAYDRNVNSDAVVFLVGARWGNLMALYSYDFSLSKMVVKSGGSHEVTITWKWYNSRLIKKKNKKNMGMISCPMSNEFLDLKKSQSRQHQQRSVGP